MSRVWLCVLAPSHSAVSIGEDIKTIGDCILRRALTIWLVAVVAGLCTNGAFAIINPSLLKTAQRRSPEQLVLQVRQVEVSKSARSWAVTAQATVLEVKRSDSGLVVGDKITIQYTSRRPPKGKWSGPKPTPVVERGQVGAYLRGVKKTRIYGPAARSYSFTTPKKLRKTPASKPSKQPARTRPEKTPTSPEKLPANPKPAAEPTKPNSQ